MVRLSIFILCINCQYFVDICIGTMVGKYSTLDVNYIFVTSYKSLTLRIELIMDFLFDLSVGLFIFKSILKFYQKSFEKDDMITMNRILYISDVIWVDLCDVYGNTYRRCQYTIINIITVFSTMEGS